jgi:ABC-2 type transport system ATP-binding protein
MLVGEYLDYCAATYRIRRSGREQLVRDVLVLTDLVDMADFPTDALSRGNRQRLALARTLINDPEVLLLDEPASGLDPIARVEFRELLKTLHGMGKTILISSHILSELGDLCSRVFMISAGRIIASGKIGELQGELSHRSVLEFTFATDRDALRAEEWFKRNHPRFFEQYSGNRGDRVLRFSGAVEELEVGFFLKSMIQEEIRVVFCNRTTPSLEDVFLDKTVGR